MSDDTPDSLIPYDSIVQEALRAVVGRVLGEIEQGGSELPGAHHFYITFKTHAPGVSIPAALRERVFVGGAPFLGICVGMQLLATRGLEHGETPGLGWIDGAVRKIEPSDISVKVPHMGWNDVAPMPHARGHDVLVGGEAYFLHSYHFKVRHHEDVLAMTDHGGGLVAAVGRDNVVGVQFHPEKSQAYGLDLLSKFLEWKP